uniref:TSET complex subunit TCUP n=1 Tax=Emiliania huxleyi TaxID=2903 RepID=A0A0M4J466_EMIHU|nr:TSET complex subunit TCUP [Emiliania huxleyi]
MYTVSLPPTRDPKPLPLMKYVASGRWRPVPVYVDAEAAEAAGGVRVRAAVETNPQLKTPLQDVAVALRVQDEGARCCDKAVEPAGGWDEAGSSVKWRIDELAREKPASCSALVAGGGAPAREACSRGTMQVQFGCEGVTITGIELEVQVGTTGSPVSRLLRRFTSGKYEARQHNIIIII